MVINLFLSFLVLLFYLLDPRRGYWYFLAPFLSQPSHCLLSSLVPSLLPVFLCSVSHCETWSLTHPSCSMEQTQPHWWWSTHYPDCTWGERRCREAPQTARRWTSGIYLSGVCTSSQEDGSKSLLHLCCPCGNLWGPIIMSISHHENRRATSSLYGYVYVCKRPGRGGKKGTSEWQGSYA